MQGNTQSTAGRLIADRNLRRKFFISAAVLGLVVLFTVFYILVLPAITMEGLLLCGQEEHAHIDACYGDTLICQVTEETPVDSSPRQLLRDITETPLSCDTEEGHSHSDSCYTTESTLICQLEEEETPIHRHDGDCYQEEILLLCEEDHDHGEDCYTAESQLICMEETEAVAGHIHDDECYAVETILLCEEEEIAVVHVHDESCYTEVEVGDDLDVEEETVEHVHTEACYGRGVVCGHEEHVHTDACYATEAEMIGLAGGISPALFDENGYSSELEDFLTGFVIKDKSDVPIGDGSIVYIGETYKIELTFKEIYELGNSKQFMYNTDDEDGRLTYQLPAEIKIITPVDDGKIVHPISQQILGEYTISQNGLIEVRFYDGINVNGYPDEKFADYNYIDFMETIFTVELSAELGAVGDGDKLEIDFGDGLEIIVDLEQKLGRLEVTKTRPTWDHVKHLFNYVVKVTARDAEVNDITLVDKIWLETLGENQGTPNFNGRPADYPALFTLLEAGAYKEVWVKKEGDAEYSKGPYTVAYSTEYGQDIEDGTFTITITDAEGQPICLEADEYFELKYTLKPGDNNFMYEEDGNIYFGIYDEDGNFIQTRYIFNGSVTNRVTATGTVGDGSEVEKSAEVKNTVNFWLIDKTDGTRKTSTEEYIIVNGEDEGKPISVGSTVVEWTIYVGDGYFDMTGQTVLDLLDPSLFYLSTSDGNFLKVVPGSRNASGGFNPSTSTYPTFYPTWEEVESGYYDAPFNRNFFKWVIPTTEQKLANSEWVYQITYYTTAPPDVPASTAYPNDATLGIEPWEGPYDTGTTKSPAVGKPIDQIKDLKKVGKYAVDSEGNPCIAYTISVTIPAEIYGKDLHFHDLLKIKINGIATEAVIPLSEIYDISFELKKLDGEEIDREVYRPFSYQNGSHQFFFFGLTVEQQSKVEAKTMGTEDAKKACRWLVEEDSVLTITYRIPLDATNKTTSQTIAELMESSDFTYIRNDLYFRIAYGNSSESGSKTAVSYVHPMISKKVERCYWGLNSKTEVGSYGWIPESNGNFIESRYQEALKTGKTGFYYTVDINPRGWDALRGEDLSDILAPVFSDSFDSRLVYSPHSMRLLRLTRTEGTNGTPGMADQYPSGGLTSGNRWGLEDTIGGWNQPIADTTSYVNYVDGSNQMSLNLGEVNRQINDTNPITRGTKADFISPYWYAQVNSFYRVIYVLTLKEDVDIVGVNTYENTATITLFDKNGDPYTFSADADITHGTPVITKTLENNKAEAGNIGKVAEFKIVINPEGRKLTTNEDGIMEIEDIMTNLSLYRATLTVKVNGSDEAIPLTYSPEKKLYHYTTAALEDGKEKFVIYLPDSTPIEITYSVLVQADVDELVSIANWVSITGTYYSDEVEEYEYKVTASSASGGNTAGEALTIFKYNSLNPDRKLEGAVFVLYSAMLSTPNPIPIDDALPEGVTGDMITPTITRNEINYHFYSLIVTDENGMVTIEDNAMTPGSVWAIREIKQPDGYFLNDEVIYFHMDGVHNKTIPAFSERVSDSIYIPNDPYHTALPETGGSGTILYTIIGLMLMGVTGVVLLFRYSRKGGRSAA